MGEETKTTQTPGQELNPKANAPTQESVVENPQMQTTEEMAAIADRLKEQNDRFENNLERLDETVLALDKAFNALASAKGVKPVELTPQKEYKPIEKSKKS
jgi:hypothetical protein